MTRDERKTSAKLRAGPVAILTLNQPASRGPHHADADQKEQSRADDRDYKEQAEWNTGHEQLLHSAATRRGEHASDPRPIRQGRDTDPCSLDAVSGPSNRGASVSWRGCPRAAEPIRMNQCVIQIEGLRSAFRAGRQSPCAATVGPVDRSAALSSGQRQGRRPRFPVVATGGGP